MAKPYLLDADVFIQAKNLYYRFEFATGFWEWIDAAHRAGIVFSIRKVRSQLVASKKGDPVRAWAEAMPETFFLDDVKDAKTMKRYGEVIVAVQSKKQYSLEAKKEFAQNDNADAFLIAAAARHGSVLVTHEVAAPDSRSNVKIPDAADLLNVSTLSLFDLLSKHAGANFKFKQ